MSHPRSLNILSHSALGRGPASQKSSSIYIKFYLFDEKTINIYTYEMLSERLKGAAMLVADSAEGFVIRVIRNPHVLDKMLHLVELSVAACTFVPVVHG